MSLQALGALLLSTLLLAAASAWLTGLLTQDSITEPLRERIWRRWPYTGAGLPDDLEGSAFDEPGIWSPSRGTFLGDLIACYRCLGVWVTAAWCAAWWLTLGAPGAGLGWAARAVLCAIQFGGACQVQRLTNRWTPV